MLSKFFRRKIVTAILVWACIICAAAGVFTLLPGRQSVSAEGTEETNVAYVGGGTGYTSLQAAIDAAVDNDTITICADIDLNADSGTNGVHISGKSLAFEGAEKSDGGKYTVSTSSMHHLISIEGGSGSTVSFKNLNLVTETPGSDSAALRLYRGGLTVKLENVNIDTSGAGTHDTAIDVSGDTATPIDLNITNCNITSSEIGYNVMIYSPVKINVTGGSFSGWNNLYFHSAKYSYSGSNGSAVEMNGTKLVSENVHKGPSNGFGAVMLDADGINVNFKGCDISVSAADAEAYQAFALLPGNGNTANISESKVALSGQAAYLYRSINTTNGCTLGAGVEITSAGGESISDYADYLAEGMIVYETADGAYGVGDKNTALESGCAAVIGNVAYKTLKEAVAAAGDGDTITVIANETHADGIVVPSDKNFTIDFDGHTYTVTQNFAGSTNSKNQAFQLLRDSDITMENGTITRGDDGVLVLIQNYANLTLENMKLDANDSFDSDCEALGVNNGNVLITGETKLRAKEGALAFDIYYWPTGSYTDGATVTFDDAFSGVVEGTVAYSSDGTDDGNIHNKAVLEINGSGTFNITFDVKEDIDENITANGGKFDFLLPEEYLGEGAALYTDGTGNYEAALESDPPQGKEKVAVIMNGAGYATIEKAIAAAGEGEIALTLYDDLVEDVEIPKGKTVTLDLNGKKITDDGDHTITNYGTLTVTGSGTVDNTTHARGALFNLGTATLLGGKYVRSEEDSKTNSWYTIKNLGHLTVGKQGEGCPVEVIQEDGTFSSLLTNGYADADEKVGGDYATYSKDVTTADKIPTLVINGGTFSGGLNTVKNDNHGIATINGGSFVNSSQAAVLNWNELTVTGGTFNQDGIARYALITSYDDTGYNNGKTIIEGGSFTGTIIAYDLGEVSISGGTFSTMPKEKFFETGYAATWDKEKQAYVAGEGTFVASVGEYSYTTLQQAINAAADGKTVILLSDVVISETLIINKAIKLDLKGYTIASELVSDGRNYAINITSNNVTITGSGADKEARGKITARTLALRISGYKNVTIENIAIESKTTAIQVGLGAGSHVTVDGVTIDAHAGILVAGNYGDGNAALAADPSSYNTLVLKNSTVNGMAYSVLGNGTNHGTNISIENSTLYAEGTPSTVEGEAQGKKAGYGIYHPQVGILTVSGNTEITAPTGIEMRAGTLNISDDTVTVDSSAGEFFSIQHGNGTTLGGVAIGLSQYDNDYPVSANISGGTFIGPEGGYAFYETDNHNETGYEAISASISGGTFNGAVESENVTGYITGGMLKELPAENAFAAGLAGELYNGYYLVVNAEEAGAAPSLADRLSAQSELRGYLAAFGLTVADMQIAAESDELAADIIAGYESILAASTKDDVAKALAAAMDAADVYKLGLDFEKAAAITELTEYAAKGAEGEGLAIVVVPTYAISAINAAVTADEISTYVAAAKAEMDDIRARRYEAEAQLAEVNEQFTAIMQALGITGSAENGYSSKVLENLNGVIEALGIKETGGEWSTDLLKDITSKIETANENITAIQKLLGTATDDETAHTLVGMIKATQGDIAKAEENIEKLIKGLSSNITDELGSLTELVQSLPDKTTVSALTEQLSALGSTVDTMNTTVSGLGTDIDSLETAVKTLTEAQTMLAQTVENYKSAVETMLGDLSKSIGGLHDMLGGESGLDAIKGDLEEVLTALGTATDGDTLFGLLNTVESGNTAILTAISELRTTLTGTLGDIQTDLDEAATALGTVTGALAEETGWVSEDIAAAKAEIDKIAAAVGSFGSEDGDLATQIGEVVTALENVRGTVGSIAESVNASTAVEEVKNTALTDIETWLNAYVDNILGANGEQQARSGGIVTFAVTEETTEGDVYAKLVQAFDEKNAQLVLRYYNDALTAIDSATTVSEVTTAVAAFKAQVASVEAAAGNATDVNLTGVYVLLAVLLAAMVAAIVIMLVKNRRQPAEQTAAPAPVQAAEPAAAQVTESVSVQPEATVTAEEETAATDDDKERVVITANVRTFSEAYDDLSEQSREMFNKVREYSLTKDNAVELRQSTGICVKRNGKQIVKLTVRRNAPVAMFYLENEMLKDFRRESNSRPKLKVHATELTLREEADLEAAYRMVDLSVEQIDKDIEAKKERARELRRLRRQQKAAQKGNENNLT